jgi:hypothetical protein
MGPEPIGRAAPAKAGAIGSGPFDDRCEEDMTGKANTHNMALFCDFENIALGVRDTKFPAFDIQKVLERLLLKGNIVVKKAYCDWDRYKEFKPAMHEASFALDLCYTKSHVDTFVIISGDSDFSPLVSKLRENNKLVIGVGVKNSSSDLLIANCDEFIYYDDLVRDTRRPARSRKKAAVKTTAARKKGKAADEEKQQDAIDLVLETVEDLFKERGAEEKVWGSMVKQTLKRRKPGFNETYHGFRTFGQLLEEAQARNLLELEADEKSGGYIIKSFSSEE